MSPSDLIGRIVKSRSPLGRELYAVITDAERSGRNRRTAIDIRYLIGGYGKSWTWLSTWKLLSPLEALAIADRLPEDFDAKECFDD